MKVEIKVTCFDLTSEEKERIVRLGVQRCMPGLCVNMKQGIVTREDMLKYEEYLLAEGRAECIESFRQRLIADSDKLITWDEDVFHDRVTAYLQIVLPEGVNPKELQNR